MQKKELHYYEETSRGEAGGGGMLSLFSHIVPEAFR
jgi:hypothetical protein